jgi:tRNA/rRNA methyltransferase
MAKPVVILVRPQLGENIGMAARAMGNFGLDELRLVAPRDGWPNPAAGPAAAGAAKVIARAKVFSSVGEAIADLNRVFAATVRSRDMPKPVVDAKKAAKAIIGNGKAGILFGPERAGLSNEDVVLADTVLTIPVSPALGSLNLALAVGVVGYEWFLASGQKTKPAKASEPAAPKADLFSLFKHLEGELEERGYYHPEARRASLKRALRNLLQGAHMTRQQVQTLRGVIRALARRTAGR